MPEKRTMVRARKAKRAGKAVTTLAGDYVRATVAKARSGASRMHEPVIFVGLSKTARIGAARPAAKRSKAKARPQRSVEHTYAAAPAKRTTTRRRSRPARATSRTLTSARTSTAARRAPSRRTSRTPPRRTAQQRSAAALKAARTKGFAGRSAAARKAARTRARNKRARGA